MPRASSNAKGPRDSFGGCLVQRTPLERYGPLGPDTSPRRFNGLPGRMPLALAKYSFNAAKLRFCCHRLWRHRLVSDPMPKASLWGRDSPSERSPLDRESFPKAQRTPSDWTFGKKIFASNSQNGFLEVP